MKNANKFYRSEENGGTVSQKKCSGRDKFYTNGASGATRMQGSAGGKRNTFAKDFVSTATKTS